jgi:flagellar basal body-associated protein FliL
MGGVTFDISDAEKLRLALLIAVVLLMASGFAFYVWHSRRVLKRAAKDRQDQIDALESQAANLESAITNMATRFKNDTLTQAEKIGQEVRDETATQITAVQKKMEEIRARLDAVEPVVTDTHIIVKKHLDKKDG